MTTQPPSMGPHWQIWVGLFVGAGMIATIVYTIIENFWG